MYDTESDSNIICFSGSILGMFYVGFLYRYLHIQISIISILQFCVVIIVSFTANRSWPTFQRRERIWLLVIQRAKPCSENPSLKWIEKELPNKNKSHTMSSYIFNSKHQGHICNTHVEIKLTIVLSDVQFYQCHAVVASLLVGHL